jgi:cellulose synthase/poly-beta-1,6-N-acetylglucosamine synthase-like glycosyltransferase
MFIASNPGAWPYAIFVALLAFYLGISYFIGIFGTTFDYAKHREVAATWFDRALDASVDVYLPICGEPRDLVRNTWVYVRQLRIVHPNVTVYVLDDKNDPAMREMAGEFKFEYITRSTNELKKAGNLRNAFKQTSGEFIVIFDADFCPKSTFLIETLPYFFVDKLVGIVQTPQFFRVTGGMNWLERGAAMIQELFYRLIQVNRSTYNGAICVGTNAVYRRSALAPFGGTAAIEYSEDVHTGFQIVSTGGRIVYIPLILAMGVCPDAIKQYFTQQYRWAMGSISLFFSRKFWVAPLSAMQRVCYLSGMFYYVTTALFVIVSVLPSFVMLLFFPEKIAWYNLLASVPSLLYGTLYLYFWTSLGGTDVKSKIKAVHNSLSARHVAYFAHLFALVDYVRGNLEAWSPTGVKSKSKRYAWFRVFYTAHTLGIFLGVYALLFKLSFEFHISNFYLLAFFTLFNFAVAFPPLIAMWEIEE